MGGAVSIINPGQYGVEQRVRLNETWTNRTHAVYDETDTIQTILTANGYAGLVVLSPGDVITAYIRGPSPVSSYVEVGLNERLENLTQHLADNSRQYFLRFGVENDCPPSCGPGAVNLIYSVYNALDDTYTLTFSDLSTAVVSAVPGLGAPGADGADGAPGADGADGADGNSITSVVALPGGQLEINMTNLPTVTTISYTGPQGLPGVPGQNGTNGLNGTDGADGADGVNGLNGVDGTDGADGDQGTGVASVFYNVLNGILTVTMDDILGTQYFTTDLRGADGATGPGGPVGATGAQGDAITLTSYMVNIDNTTTLNFSDNSSVVIPAGQVGADGPVGTSVTDVIDLMNGFIRFELTDALGGITNVDLPLSVTAPQATGPITVSLGDISQKHDGSYDVRFMYTSAGNTVPFYAPDSNSAPFNRVTINGGDIPVLRRNWYPPSQYPTLAFTHNWNGIQTLEWDFTDPTGNDQTITVTPAYAAANSTPYPWLPSDDNTGAIQQGVPKVWRNLDGTVTAEWSYAHTGATVPLRLVHGSQGATNRIQHAQTGGPFVYVIPPNITQWLVPTAGGATAYAFEYTWDPLPASQGGLGPAAKWFIGMPSWSTSGVGFLYTAHADNAMYRPWDQEIYPIFLGWSDPGTGQGEAHWGYANNSGQDRTIAAEIIETAPIVVPVSPVNLVVGAHIAVEESGTQPSVFLEGIQGDDSNLTGGSSVFSYLVDTGETTGYYLTHGGNTHYVEVVNPF